MCWLPLHFPSQNRNVKDFGCLTVYCYLPDLIEQPTQNQIKSEGQLSAVTREEKLPRLRLNRDISWIISHRANNVRV